MGNNIKIDLGDKNVYLDDNSKLSLNEMTIDGNENINITPSDGKVKDDKKIIKEILKVKIILVIIQMAMVLMVRKIQLLVIMVITK